VPVTKKPLIIVFCIPGDSFSGKFLESYTGLLAFCFDNNIRIVLSRAQSCNIYYVRNMGLGADLMRGKHQKPFSGKLDDEDLFKKCRYFNFLTLQDINGKEDLIEFSYTGMGFMLVKKGVFENMEYPWFKPIEK